ncbi:PREDICTED: agamous-like MADS-box protein AGL62 [Tarenaya hassleriana]|uniref:agamous-like MADS-box protein AGL62 n=1 Tax=Tarenaya hassleriana TaxID=28532 RepID=UPI00053C6609|nr:PREDICTED: agamous-like MADS-box protein AGL62 [Tarenaya hassleriana]
MAGKKTKGKQKILMKKIENMEDKLSTFSKRRSGIYKKFNDLIITCNAEIGFLMFTEADTPFSFGHPLIETVCDKLRNPLPPRAKTDTDSLADAREKQRIDRLNEEYENLLGELEGERERRKALEKLSEEKKIEECWFKAPVEKLNGDEIQLMHDTFLELHDALCDELFNRLSLNDEGTSSIQ